MATCLEYYSTARNNSWSLAIFRPTSAFGQPKSNFPIHFQQSIAYKISYFQSPIKYPIFRKTADQFLILISSTVTVIRTYVHIRSYMLYITDARICIIYTYNAEVRRYK